MVQSEVIRAYDINKIRGLWNFLLRFGRWRRRSSSVNCMGAGTCLVDLE